MRQVFQNQFFKDLFGCGAVETNAGDLWMILEKQIEIDKPKLAKLDEALAQCDYSNTDAAKKASLQHEERSKLAAQLEIAENELLEAMVEIESLEEALASA